ncbi:MAG TPA: phosphodiester glycosidase family protein [Candidatus Kapabacteria bacterium]|nr:phosphodiester glycosidase family protein [Candidatus Kapabacteria bacterium]
MRRAWIVAAAFLACVIAGGIALFLALQSVIGSGPAGSRSSSAGPVVPDTAAYITLTLDSRTASIGMYWLDDQDRGLRSIQRLRSYVEHTGDRLRFAMNGGMFRKDHSPVGLFIQHGRVLSPLDTSSGPGNFYLKPNGVFLVRKDHTAAIVTTDRFEYLSNIDFATQSGPMLLIDGAIHPVFVKGSEHLNVRNGVGVRDDGAVIFAMSRDKVSLYDFASYFKALGCRNALYLDGFVSRCYCPEKNCTQLDGDFGVMIGITEKDAKARPALE